MYTLDPRTPHRRHAVNARQRGVSLIELIMFITIVSIAVAGILLVMNTTAKSSADPLIEKQALEIAESLLEEVTAMPFTFCDPDDASAVTATSPAGCTIVENIGPEPGEVRTDPTNTKPLFDNVNDYHGFSMSGVAITDVTGSPIVGVEGYTANITVANAPLNNVAAAESLLITVNVVRAGGYSVTLEGYRTRFAPRMQ